MTDKFIKDGNIIIAKMLGYKQINWFSGINFLVPFKEFPKNIEMTIDNFLKYSRVVKLSEIKFHSDYNHMMEAFLHIEKFGFNITEGRTPFGTYKCLIDSNDLRKSIIENSKKCREIAIFRALIKYSKQYEN